MGQESSFPLREYSKLGTEKHNLKDKASIVLVFAFLQNAKNNSDQIQPSFLLVCNGKTLGY